MATSLLHAVGDWAYWLCLIGANFFVIAYALLAKWWKKQMGRNLFFFMLVLALVLDHALIYRLVGEYRGRVFVRAFLNVSAAVVVWWRVVLFIRVQILKRKDPARIGEHEDSH